MLWTDKHAPRTLEELDVHPALTALLQKQTKCPILPHLLLYGASGSGKKTRAMALLRKLFGSAVDKVSIESYGDSESNTEAAVCRSPHHVLLSCQEFGAKDRQVVQGILKDMAEKSTHAAAASSLFASPAITSSATTLGGPPRTFKVCLLQDADALSEAAQHAMRRTLETSSHLRFIFLVERLERFSPPLKSRCFCIRVPLPAHKEVVAALRGVCEKEGLSPEVAPDALLLKISQQSNRNLRRAILAVECIATYRYSIYPPPAATTTGGQPLQMPPPHSSPFPLPWERLADEVAAQVYEHQTPRSLSECRNMVYELLAALIPGELIIVRVLQRLLLLLHERQADTGRSGYNNGFRGSGSSSSPRPGGGTAKTKELQGLLVHAAAHFAHTMRRGSKEIVHIEAFLAQAMRLIRGASAGAAAAEGAG